MKRKLLFVYNLILVVALLAACQDDDENGKDLENTLPPGPEYVKEGPYCVNVVYYAVKGMDTLANWHRLYSSYMTTLQEVLQEQMALCGYPQQTVNLEHNKQNPLYVKIIRVEGQADTVWKRGYMTVVNEVRGYFAQHPEEKQSNFTMIFAPNGGFLPQAWTLTEQGKVAESGMICTYQTADLSGTLIGNLFQVFGKMCFLENNTEPVSDNYFSMMNKEKINSWKNGYCRLLKADAMLLHYNQILSPESGTYFAEAPQVNVTRTELKYEHEAIVVNCEFTSPQHITGVVVYNDPWSYPDREDEILDNGYTTSDAIPYGTEEVNKNGSNYKITVRIPWKDLPVTYTVPNNDMTYREAEIRFRFITEDGLAVPLRNKGDILSGYRYPYKIKNYVPDFEDKVDTEIKEEPNEETE